MSFGTGSTPCSPREHGCQSPLSLSIGPVSWFKVMVFDWGNTTGLAIAPDDKLAVTAKDLSTSMQFRA